MVTLLSILLIKKSLNFNILTQTNATGNINKQIERFKIFSQVSYLRKLSEINIYKSKMGNGASYLFKFAQEINRKKYTTLIINVFFELYCHAFFPVKSVKKVITNIEQNKLKFLFHYPHIKFNNMLIFNPFSYPFVTYLLKLSNTKCSFDNSLSFYENHIGVDWIDWIDGLTEFNGCHLTLSYARNLSNEIRLFARTLIFLETRIFYTVLPIILIIRNSSCCDAH